MGQNEALIKEISRLPFEEALARLETIVSGMEDGNVPLEALIEQFEEGRILAAYCQKKLDHLKQKVELLTRDSGTSGDWEELSTNGIVESKSDFLPEEATVAPKPSAPAPAPAPAPEDGDLLF